MKWQPFFGRLQIRPRTEIGQYFIVCRSKIHGQIYLNMILLLFTPTSAVTIIRSNDSHFSVYSATRPWIILKQILQVVSFSLYHQIWCSHCLDLSDTFFCFGFICSFCLELKFIIKSIRCDYMSLDRFCGFNMQVLSLAFCFLAVFCCRKGNDVQSFSQLHGISFVLLFPLFLLNGQIEIDLGCVLPSRGV